MKKLLLILLAVFAASAAFCGDLNIAVVDMRKLFQDYERTRHVEKKLQEQMDIFKEYSAKLNSEYQTLKKEFETTRDAAQNNFALSEAERKNRELRAKDLYEQLIIKQTELKNYSRSRQTQLQETYEKLRSEILNEIKNAVRSRATLSGYRLVLDQSGTAAGDVGAVVFAAPGMDITKSVLDELNRAYRKSEDKNK